MKKKSMMTNRARIALVLVTALTAVEGFSSNKVLVPKSTCPSSRRPQTKLTAGLKEDNDKSSISKLNRRDAIGQACRTAAVIATSAAATNPTVSNADIAGVVSMPRTTAPAEPTSKNVGDGKSVTVFKTKSGLQYIDIEEGTGGSPRYGNFVTIAYKAYVKLPDIQGKPFKLDEFDTDNGYLVKHGNGRNVPGLDEGLHTMKVGGKRRIIIPPKLGYISSGLGPIPEGPYGRWKLNRLIDRMIEVKGGNVIFDVEMKSILEDEADQGYYEDDSLSPDDFNTLRKNIEEQQQASRGA